MSGTNYCSEHGKLYYVKCSACSQNGYNGVHADRIGSMTTTDPSKMIRLPSLVKSDTSANLPASETVTEAKLSSGVKFDQGKPRMDLISYPALEELAKVLEFGARKYEPWNWAKGIHFSRVIGAVERHIGKWKNRQDLDDETNLSHLAHAMCGLMFLLDYTSRDLSELDDRRPKDTVKALLDSKSSNK